MKKTSLLNNSRFYILAFSFLLSLLIVGILRINISSDQLFYIRTEQIFGLVAVLYWYGALAISPIGYIVGKHRTKKLEFARRAIGVSAFYFVLLHGVVAVWGQLGGPTELQYLPELFKWSLFGGMVAFVILAAMAATSFDRVVRFMTYRKWKWLHRLVYLGGVLAVLHIWTVGTHLAYDSIQLVAFIALVILSGLELYRVTKRLNEKYFHLDTAEVTTLFISVWLVVATLILMIPAVVQNYHSRHADHTSAHVLITDASKTSGAIVHIIPDDDPIAGEEATIYFDLQSELLGPESKVALEIEDTYGMRKTVETAVDGTLVTAAYTFAVQGVYTLGYTVSTQNDVYRFTHVQRVSRGVSSGALQSQAYPWAEALVVASSVGVAVLGVLAVNRRHEIAKHSTF